MDPPARLSPTCLDGRQVAEEPHRLSLVVGQHAGLTIAGFVIMYSIRYTLSIRETGYAHLVSNVEGRRRYSSPTRAEAALDTRRAVVAAAAAMFAERGQGVSPFSDVAEVAGVAHRRSPRRSFQAGAAALGTRRGPRRRRRTCARRAASVVRAGVAGGGPASGAGGLRGVLHGDRRPGRRMFEVVEQAVDQPPRSPSCGHLSAIDALARRWLSTVRSPRVSCVRADREPAIRWSGC